MSVRRLAVGVAFVAVALAITAPIVGASDTTPLASAAKKKKPKLKNACKLLSSAKVSAIGGKRVLAARKLGLHPGGRYKFACSYITQYQGEAPPRSVDLAVSPFKNAKGAKAEYKFRRSGPFDPQDPAVDVSGIGDKAFLFGGIITVRSGRYLLEAGSNDLDIIGQGGSRANSVMKRIAKPAVRKLRKSYR